MTEKYNWMWLFTESRQIFNIFAHRLMVVTFHYEKEEGEKKHRILSTRIGISIKSDKWFYDFTLLHAEN